MFAPVVQLKVRSICLNVSISGDLFAGGEYVHIEAHLIVLSLLRAVPATPPHAGRGLAGRTARKASKGTAGVAQ